MALLVASRNTPKYDMAGARLVVPVEAATSIYVGGMVAIDANGYGVPAQPYGAAPLNVLRIVGVCDQVYAGAFPSSALMAPGVNANNLSTSAAQFPPNLPNLGSAGAICVGVDRIAAFGVDNDGSITEQSIGQMAFAGDDHTASLTDGSGGTVVANTTSITLPAAAPLANVLHPYIQPGSFNAYSATGGGGTHYVENTDFAVNYQSGLFSALPGGALGASGVVFVAYKYGQATRPVIGQILSVEGGLVYVDFSRQTNPTQQAAALDN